MTPYSKSLSVIVPFRSVPNRPYLMERLRKVCANAQVDERFDYLYNEDELQGFIRRVNNVARKSLTCYIVFSNYPRGQAIVNALQLQYALTMIGFCLHLILL